VRGKSAAVASSSSSFEHVALVRAGSGSGDVLRKRIMRREGSARHGTAQQGRFLLIAQLEPSWLRWTRQGSGTAALGKRARPWPTRDLRSPSPFGSRRSSRVSPGSTTGSSNVKLRVQDRSARREPTKARADDVPDAGKVRAERQIPWRRKKDKRSIHTTYSRLHHRCFDGGRVPSS
jgi:hypothetical protein